VDRFNFNVQIKEVEKVNPLFSKCKIYICYSDLNRNNSDIPKNVISDALYSLYGVPIVGEFSKSKGDFLDHGGAIEIDENGNYEYVTTTIPYGYINETSEIQWETVDGEEYLTATGYLWTGRYPEALKAVEEGRPQSMEIDNVKGEFNNKKNFVVSSFVFSALCILGNDVEPCFEEAKITAYTIDKDEFKKEFTQMINELKFSLSVDDKTNKVDDIGNSSVVDTQFNNKQAKEVEKVKSKLEIASQFKLTASQLFDEFNRVLGEVKYEGENWWGETVERNKYYLRDYDESFAYVVDCQNDYMDMKIPYSTEGDNLVLDYASASRIKYAPVDWEGGTADDPDYTDDIEIDVVQDFVKQVVSEAKEKIAKIEAEFTVERETFSTEKDSLTAELTQKDVIISEKEDAILAFDSQIQSITEESQAKDATIETLTAFKLKVEEAERKDKVEALFAKFSKHFSKDEMEDFRNRESEFASYELFEKEVKSFAADKLVESVKEGKSEFSQMAIVDNQIEIKPEQDQPKDVWSRLSK
jgi:hypothetical protein